MKSKIVFILYFFLSVQAHSQPTHVCQEENILAQTPAERFSDKGDGTVVDSKTGLVWKKCVEGKSGDVCSQGEAIQLTWADTLLYLNSRPAVVAEGWRLPNIRELSTIIESQCMYPAINIKVFPGTPSNHVWTSSPYHFYTHYSWYVDFSQGIPTSDEKIRFKGLRLVRNLKSGEVKLMDSR